MEMTATFSPPANDLSAERPTFQLRRRAACSVVKRHLLRDRHQPFEAQQTAMAKALQAFVQDDSEFRGATWRGWWSGEREMKTGKLALLDRASGEAPGFIQELVLGGSLGQPFSPLHGHFDALDAAGYFGRGSEDWESRRWGMALSVLSELHQKWRPNLNRQVPGAFPKSWLRVQYEALATSEEREAFAKETGGNLKVFFDMKLNNPDPLSGPVFEAYDPQSPACMPRFLFAVGHDVEFLSDDKIDAWAWDLATASLALWGLLFAERYDSMLGGQREYAWLWQQVYSLFWRPPESHSPVSDRDFLLYIVDLQHSAENEAVLDIFSRARKRYVERLNELGLLTSDIKTVFDRPWTIRPIVLTP
jgi:hypothetical protein